MKLKKVGVLFCLLLVMGCDQVRMEQSDFKTESAIVSGLVYTPAHYTTTLIPVPSMDADGDLTVHLEDVDVYISEKYSVTFKCEHGAFTIERNQARTKALYEKLMVGQEVTVTYRDVYEKTRDSNGKIISKRRIKYDFIGVE